MSFFKRYKSIKTNTEKYIFVMSSGRCGTTHLSKIFSDPKLVTNHERVYTRDPYKVLTKYLRPIAQNNDTSLAVEYVQDRKLPFIQKLMEKSSAETYFETGHLTNFGIFPALILNIRNIKIIRLRRDRYDTVRSFMTRVEANDIWNKPIGKSPHRWTHSPFDKMSLLTTTQNQWDQLSRFQKYLWAIDEVERQWIQLKTLYSFPFLEVNVENLEASGYVEIGNFIGYKPDFQKLNVKHNSSVEKGFVKPDFTNEYMIEQDEEYMRIFNL